ncbi:hypothetical protein PQR34_30350 [Paraburkholderia sediminicola]|uniref:hypothetical protein n=1 Tax=Paraburkholderia sediminicola TaxID=458836 RepID=UPI0038BB8688
MSEPTADSDEAKPSKRAGLPPLFGPIENGKRTWVGVGAIDYELMGYLLSCHLIIEHYMETFLKVHHSELEWDDARLTFGQRVALLSTWGIEEPFNPVPAIKHLNSLRNRLGHRVDYRLTGEDMLPFIHYLQRIADYSGRPPERRLEEEPPKSILQSFILVAAAFAGSVSQTDHAKGITKRTLNADAAEKNEDRE